MPISMSEKLSNPFPGYESQQSLQGQLNVAGIFIFSKSPWCSAYRRGTVAAAHLLSDPEYLKCWPMSEDSVLSWQNFKGLIKQPHHRLVKPYFVSQKTPTQVKNESPNQEPKSNWLFHMPNWRRKFQSLRSFLPLLNVKGEEIVLKSESTGKSYSKHPIWNSWGGQRIQW